MMNWTPGQMIPQYDTNLFCDVWTNASEFINDFNNSGFPADILTEDKKQILFNLLYAAYGNNPIANYSVDQFKMKVFAIIFEYGPTWQKRLEIQKSLRDLSLEDAAKGGINIYNHAFNDSSIPTLDSDPNGQLKFINDQNTSLYKKSPLAAAGELWDLLKIDVTKAFINKFRNLFITVVDPQVNYIYTTEED